METPETIWTDFREPLRRFIAKRVGDPHAAEDVTQDVMLKVLAQLDNLPSDDKLPAWVFTIARNAVVDYYRAKATRDHADVNDVNPADDDSEQRAVVNEVTPCLRRMIAHLPEPYREALGLADLEGLSQQDLADRVGISLSGAKSRVQRARQLLKALLVDCCTFETDARGKVFDYQTTDRSARYCGDAGNPPCE